MNANELINQVIEIIDNPDYDVGADILKYTNRSQRRIADILLLPDLRDGSATVSTAVGAMEVSLPATFHKNLFQARFAGADIAIYKDVVSMSMARGGLSLDVGDVEAVALKKGKLVYQMVPAAITAIEIYFYRLPVAMTAADTSYPDGAYGNDDFDWAIIHDSCAKIFNRIEEGMEGAKVNTDKHETLFAERMAALDEYAEMQGKIYPNRPSSNIGWLGVL